MVALVVALVVVGLTIRFTHHNPPDVAAACQNAALASQEYALGTRSWPSTSAVLQRSEAEVRQADQPKYEEMLGDIVGLEGAVGRGDALMHANWLMSDCVAARS